MSIPSCRCHLLLFSFALAAVSGCWSDTHRDEGRLHAPIGNVPKVVVQEEPSDPHLACLGNDELIDLLAEVDAPGAGSHPTAYVTGFLPLASEGRFSGGVIGSQKPVKSGVMVELVRRGVDALPSLIGHLGDERETGLRVGNPESQDNELTDSPFEGGGKFFFSAIWYSDEYDYRYSEPGKQPGGVNSVSIFSDKVKYIRNYTVRVGDLCYVMIGDIVNRTLLAVRYQPSACLVINSQMASPALRAAVRQDWGGLTSDEHMRSLLADLADERVYGTSSGALPRLLFYYPDDGLRTVRKLLSRRLVDTSVVYDFIDKCEKCGMDGDKVADLFQQYRGQYGEDYILGLRGVLRHEMAPWQSEERREVGTRLSGEIFRDRCERTPEEDAIVGIIDQTRFVDSLEDFAWDGMNDQLFALFSAVVRERPSDSSSILDRVDLALACALRLRGGDRDEQLRVFFEGELARLRTCDAEAVASSASLPLGYAGYHVAFSGRIEKINDFLTSLANGPK